MAAKPLRQELGKKKPFESPEKEAMLNIARTSDQFQNRFGKLFRSFGLTGSQHNVLRILRGEDRPMRCDEIRSRMIQVVPAMTGLLDRLEKDGLVTRSRCEKDGRVVCVDLTTKARNVLQEVDDPLNAGQGVTPVVCIYTIRADLDRAFKETGAKKVFVITDSFRAARSNADLEFRQGRDAIDAAEAAGVDHLIFMSVADAECFDEHTTHLKAKVELEKYLRQSGVPFSILRPCAFFGNLGDAANWNPLKKGVVRFLTLHDCKYCATYDIGRAAAIQFRNRAEWLGKSLDVIKRVVPDALCAEDWFRFHNRYADGTPIAAEPK